MNVYIAASWQLIDVIGVWRYETRLCSLSRDAVGFRRAPIVRTLLSRTSMEAIRNYVAVRASHLSLIPGGRMMIGWRKGLTPDPFSLSNMLQLFRRDAVEPLLAHKSVPDDQHLYDFFAALPV